VKVEDKIDTLETNEVVVTSRSRKAQRPHQKDHLQGKQTYQILRSAEDHDDKEMGALSILTKSGILDEDVLKTTRNS